MSSKRLLIVQFVLTISKHPLANVQTDMLFVMSVIYNLVTVQFVEPTLS